jgi:hypothetical protein
LVDEFGCLRLVHYISTKAKKLSKWVNVKSRISPGKKELLGVLSINQVTLIFGKWVLGVEVDLDFHMECLLSTFDETIFEKVSTCKLE